MKCVICHKTISSGRNRSYVTVNRDNKPHRKLYACETCSIDNGPFDRLIDALPTGEDGNPLDIKRTELEALKLTTDRKRLERRLRGARSNLILFDRRRNFGHGRFDFDKRTLTGDNGIVLQWQTRNKPDEPITYQNQQTQDGTVIIANVQAKIIPAIRVTGYRTNCPHTHRLNHGIMRCAHKPYTLLPSGGIPEWCPLSNCED